MPYGRHFAVALTIQAVLLCGSHVSATPSATHWTYATTDIQAFNVWHVGVINFFRLSRSTEDAGLLF
jgi:hypothetical protein